MIFLDMICFGIAFGFGVALSVKVLELIEKAFCIG